MIVRELRREPVDELSASRVDAYWRYVVVHGRELLAETELRHLRIYKRSTRSCQHLELLIVPHTPTRRLWHEVVRRFSIQNGCRDVSVEPTGRLFATYKE